MDGAAHDQVAIKACLAQLLQRPVRLGAYRVLGRGISGAATYLLSFEGTDAVLKLTSADGPVYVRERARREIAFYRELAPHLPVRLPEVRATHSDAAGDALLLAAYEPARPPEQGRTDRYLVAARQLARLHAAFWDRAHALDPYPWLLRPHQEDTPSAIADAHRYWRVLQERPHLAPVLTDHQAGWIHALLDRLGALDAIMAQAPLTFCHGDANPGNILTASDGALVWADWQEARLARGPEDLSFLLQQAAILGGAAIPHEAALASYHETLVAQTGADIPPTLIQRMVVAAELRSRALHWPVYLADAAPEAVATMLQRMRELATLLEFAR